MDEAKALLEEYNKRDRYTTQIRSVTSFEGFLRQCRRAIDKLHGFHIEADQEFWSMEAKDEAWRLYKHGDISNEEYEVVKHMSMWQCLRKYQELHVEDGWFNIAFEFGEIVFAALSSRALIEMGIFTEEEMGEYTDLILEYET